MPCWPFLATSREARRCAFTRPGAYPRWAAKIPEVMTAGQFGSGLAELVALAHELRDRLNHDEARLDKLMQSIRDEAWQAGLSRDSISDRAEADYRLRVRELWQTIDCDYWQLKGLTERNPT